ncbi:MAG: cysteine desulfurase [Verrucomicrobiae bacterium]|nr:cysteine desulfurase [Verrucomicrobiae bacterium]
MSRIYLDHNATTPMHPEVLDAMMPYLKNSYGNASSIHYWGREARAVVDDARERLANLLGAKPSEIVFTGGGTESDNLAIKGVASYWNRKGKRIVTSRIEHHAVFHTCEYLAKRHGYEITYVPVDSNCLVNPDDVRKAIRPDSVLVSVMAANNETGTIQPLAEIGAICREQGVPFHTDAVQAFGKIPTKPADWNADLLTIAAHKFYGPKGVGLLYVRSGTRFDPTEHGGFQENERRGGTENVAGIVGMAKAAELATAKMPSEVPRLFQLTERLWREISRRIKCVHRNGHVQKRVANTLHICCEDCDGEGLLFGLDLEGVAVSSGSACAVGSLEVSHVLLAMGRSPELAEAAVRFSFGSQNTEADVDPTVSALAKVLDRLRSFHATA